MVGSALMKRSRACFLILNTALVTLLVVVFSLVVLVRWGGPSFNFFSGGEPAGPLSRREVVSEESAIVSVAETASPSVVSIVAGRVSWDPFSGPVREEGGIGTGFIVGEAGIILTNRHVVADTKASYSVLLSDKRRYPVKDVFRDLFNDLAILKIDAVDLPAVALGNSDNLKVGQSVVAIGNALGRFSNTVTTGVVSGIGRGVSASSGLGSSEILEDVIQTDAALNPGNSGGPLFNLSAEVIGINVAITVGAQNIGFAIPINVAKATLENFEEYGRIVRPFLGINYVMISADLSELRGLPEGAFVREVIAGSPAESAGLRPADIIVKIDGVVINEQHPLARVLRAAAVGDKLRLVVSRNGEETTLEAVLGEAPSN